MEEHEIESNKALARLQREVATDTKRMTIDEMSHASRWVMASVLAINSGGLIASISKIEALEIWGIMSVVAFYLGVMTALMMGWKQISLNQRLLPIHSKAISFWELTTLDGELGDLKELERIRDELLIEGSNGTLSGTLGKWAFALFSAGLLCLGLSLVSTNLKEVLPTPDTVESND